ncbi:MAG: hypothetical protein DMG06_25255 [Acidobacteria bacterium]|nr:MAG: hypothetical protein DMG06_25255 [Acidobacteriota bacterium]
MCYYSSHAAKVVDAQAGDVLQVKTHLHGTNWLMLAGTKTVACLKPGTEVEISRIPFILRWTCKVKQGTRALFTSVRLTDATKRDYFVLGDGQVVRVNELPHRLKMKVIAVPVLDRPAQRPADLEVREAEWEEDLVAR